MKLVLGVLSSLFIIGIQGIAYDWKTPEGCTCSCPASYNGPYPPPSSLQHLRAAGVVDPWTAAAVVGVKPGYPGYNPYDPYTPAWNRPAVVDPYLATNPYNKRWPNNQWNAPAWNRTWPYTGVAGAGQWGVGAGAAWNRNQPWGAAAYNPYGNQWNNTWTAARQPWNRWNANYPGYAGVQDLRAAVAANDAGNNGQSNEVQKTASTRQNPYNYYYGLRQKAADTAASGTQEKK